MCIRFNPLVDLCEFLLKHERKGTWESTYEKGEYSPYSFCYYKKISTQGSYKRGIFIS